VKGREREVKKKMRLFDPWSVFFKREWKRNWPFLVGFAVTGTVITKFSLGLTGKSTFFFSQPQSSFFFFFFSEI